MQNIGHDDRAEAGIVGKGKALAVENQFDAGAGENFAGDEIGNEFVEETGTGAELENAVRGRRESPPR